MKEKKYVRWLWDEYLKPLGNIIIDFKNKSNSDFVIVLKDRESIYFYLIPGNTFIKIKDVLLPIDIYKDCISSFFKNLANEDMEENMVYFLFLSDVYGVENDILHMTRQTGIHKLASDYLQKIYEVDKQLYREAINVYINKFIGK